MLLAFASLLGWLLTSSQAKVYSRCELARALQDFGMEGYRGSTMADCENRSPSSCRPPLLPSLSPPFLPALTQGVWSWKLFEPQPSFVQQGF